MNLRCVVRPSLRRRHCHLAMAKCAAPQRPAAMSSRRFAALIFAVLASPTSARAVDGEVCGPQNQFRNGCAANQDFMLVVDASSSIALVWDEYIAFLRSFVQGFDLNPNDPSSPRIGLISFYGFPGQMEVSMEL